MSYAALETSAHGGQPVELIEFRRGLDAWRYTSGDTAYTHLSQSYEPRPFSVPEPQQTAELAKGKLDLKTPIDTPIVAEMIASPLIAMIDVTIYRRHRGDPEVIEFWHGYVAGFELGDMEATITCQQAGTWMRRLGRPRPAQRQCPHALFDGDCRLVAAAWGVSGTLISAAGAVLQSGTFASQANGWWVGGMIEAGGTLRMVVEHTSDTITLTGGVPGLAANAPFTVYPGCDHTPGTCNSKFANILNYGGLPWLPIKNPFAGDSAF